MAYRPDRFANQYSNDAQNVNNSSPKKKKEEQKPKSEPQPSLDDFYVEHQIKTHDGELRVLNSGGDANVYQWNGSFWEKIENRQGCRMAFKWLRTYNNRANVNAYNAKRCHESLKLELPELGKPPKDSYIPLIDKWLVVEGSNLKIINPTPEVNIRYCINAKLNCDSTSDYYTPKKTTNGKFYDYITSTLPDEATRNVVQEYCGYTLLNNTRFCTALVMEGEGANGKSVLLEILTALHRNFCSLRLNELAKFGLAPLIDASLAVSAETPKNGIFENEFKAAVSGDWITVEKKGQDIITYQPTAKWVIACNTFPVIKDKSDGMYRRLLIVPFDQKFGPDKAIPELAKTLIEEELKEILDWCLEGLQRLLKRGAFAPTEKMERLKREKKEENDSVIRFVQYFEYEISTSFTPKQDIYDAYRAFSIDQGTPACSQTEFWKRINRAFPNNQLQERRTVDCHTQKRQRSVNLSTPRPNKNTNNYTYNANTPITEIEEEDDDVRFFD